MRRPQQVELPFVFLLDGPESWAGANHDLLVAGASCGLPAHAAAGQAEELLNSCLEWERLGRSDLLGGFVPVLDGAVWSAGFAVDEFWTAGFWFDAVDGLFARKAERCFQMAGQEVRLRSDPRSGLVRVSAVPPSREGNRDERSFVVPLRDLAHALVVGGGEFDLASRALLTAVGERARRGGPDPVRPRRSSGRGRGVRGRLDEVRRGLAAADLSVGLERLRCQLNEVTG